MDIIALMRLVLSIKVNGKIISLMGLENYFLKMVLIFMEHSPMDLFTDKEDLFIIQEVIIKANLELMLLREEEYFSMKISNINIMGTGVKIYRMEKDNSNGRMEHCIKDNFQMALSMVKVFISSQMEALMMAISSMTNSMAKGNY